jgi:predicted glycoside hydrolase/deacetylase ChbG (UPF0249 family)
LLVDRRGRFRHGFLSLWRLTERRPSETLNQIECELKAQFERVEAAGVRIDHVDSHRHVHMIPAVFKIAARLAREYGCPAIRMSDEPWRPSGTGAMERSWRTTLGNVPKKLVLSRWARRNRRHVEGLTTADRVYGILGSGRIDRPVLETLIPRLPEGLTELLVHPGRGNAAIPSGLARGDQAFWRSVHRQSELRALVDSEIKNVIAEHGVRLISFSALGLRSCEPAAVCG